MLLCVLPFGTPADAIKMLGYVAATECSSAYLACAACEAEKG